MKKLIMVAMVAMALALSGAVNDAEAGGALKLNSAYLAGPDFTVNFGLGTIVDVIETEKKGAGFALTNLTGVGTGISDDFPVAQAAGGAMHGTYATYSDFTAYNKLVMSFHNHGKTDVWVVVYINTGFTENGWDSCGCTDGLECDIYWESDWTKVPAGKKRTVQLKFNKATPWNCDGSTPASCDGPCTDGVKQPILRLDEVSNIGYQVADFAGGPTHTWMFVK